MGASFRNPSTYGGLNGSGGLVIPNLNYATQKNINYEKLIEIDNELLIDSHFQELELPRLSAKAQNSSLNSPRVIEDDSRAHALRDSRL